MDCLGPFGLMRTPVWIVLVLMLAIIMVVRPPDKYIWLAPGLRLCVCVLGIGIAIAMVGGHLTDKFGGPRPWGYVAGAILWIGILASVYGLSRYVNSRLGRRIDQECPFCKHIMPRNETDCSRCGAFGTPGGLWRLPSFGITPRWRQSRRVERQYD